MNPFPDIPEFNHDQALIRSIVITNKAIGDVGCGEGYLGQQVKHQIKSYWGVEPSLGWVNENEFSNSDDLNFKVTEGRGEKLPFPEQSIEVLVYLNSFHHIPSEGYKEALNEAKRVLRPRGQLWISEPQMRGPYYELTRLIEDETGVRSATQEYLSQQSIFEEQECFQYQVKKNILNYDEFKSRSIKINSNRQSTFETYEKEIRNRLTREFCADEKASVFYQAMVCRIFI